MEIYCFTPGCDCANKKQEAIFSVDVGDWFKPTNHNWVFCCVLPKKVDVLIGQIVMIQGIYGRRVLLVPFVQWLLLVRKSTIPKEGRYSK